VRIPASGGRVLVQRPVRPMGVAVIGMLVEDQPQVRSPMISILSRSKIGFVW
jgi:hypothetical protein